MMSHIQKLMDTAWSAGGSSGGSREMEKEQEKALTDCLMSSAHRLGSVRTTVQVAEADTNHNKETTDARKAAITRVQQKFNRPFGAADSDKLRTVALPVTLYAFIPIFCEFLSGTCEFWEEVPACSLDIVMFLESTTSAMPGILTFFVLLLDPAVHEALGMRSSTFTACLLALLALSVATVSSARAYTPARIQKPAPDFVAEAVVNGEFKNVALHQYKGKWLVLFFYPLDFTFVCPTELHAFSDRAQEFRSIGCEVVGASVDSKHSHLAWTKMPRKDGGLGSMDIPLIADITKRIASDYGALIEDGPDEGLALRATYIIDPEGIVRHISYNDLGVGRSVDEVLRLVQALQFNAENGEVCPAGWKKGMKGLVPNPEDAKAWFRSNYDL
ncbi:hypothetical protein HK101_012081 [Irineochytrium annulatum]|nr:hypothetical protein HK101_012081 [Irineochytrium annulatum]